MSQGPPPRFGMGRAGSTFITKMAFG